MPLEPTYGPDILERLATGSDVFRVVQEQGDLHQGQEQKQPETAELWETVLVQCNCLPGNDLIIIMDVSSHPSPLMSAMINNQKTELLTEKLCHPLKALTSP